jgi:hypothetical protein
MCPAGHHSKAGIPIPGHGTLCATPPCAVAQSVLPESRLTETLEVVISARAKYRKPLF